MKLRNQNKGVKTHPQKATPNSNNNSGSTFAPALSAAWNSSKSPSSTVTNGSTTQNQTKTTCLFCPNAVVLNGPTSPNDHNPRLYKLIINLCNHLQINSAEIPSQPCTSTRFPLCSNCDSLMTLLWKQQQILEQVMLRIEKIVEDIEHVVVDGEILEMGKRPGSSSMAKIERLKFTKLRDLILDGYRQKLVRRHEQDNPDILGPMNDTEVVNPAADVKQGRFEQQIGNFTTSTDSIQFENNVEEQDDLPSSLNRQDIAEPYDHHDDQQSHTYSDTPDLPENDGNYGWSGEPAAVGTNCTMVITNENAETDVTSLIQIKQEDHAPAAEYDSDDDDDDDEARPDIFALEERKRKFLFEGVEIYRASGTGSRSKMDYLQCSLCSYSLPIKKQYTSKVSSPYMKMKTHILHIHKQKTGLPKQPRARELSCIPCSKTFSNLKELRDHKATHPADGSFKCDICLKPFKKGSSQYNLLIHKFSHKNDEERKVSIAANERGSYNSMLSGKLNMAYLAGRGRSVPKKRDRKTRSGPAPAIPSTSDNNDSSDHNCTICPRSFRRKCHLMLHMKTHVLQRAAPIPIPTSLPNSVGVVNEDISIGQRVAAADGTVVIIKREVLELLMNN